MSGLLDGCPGDIGALAHTLWTPLGLNKICMGTRKTNIDRQSIIITNITLVAGQ